MGGFSVITGDPYGSVLNADNASFDGTERGGVMTTNGQLWIGSTVAPHVRKGVLTSSDGSINFIVGNGTINLLSGLGQGRFPITPYVVGPLGDAGYQTIQSAVNAAQAAGGGIVYIQPGIYVEDVTMGVGVYLVGFIGSNGNSPISVSSETYLPVIIQGNFTLDLTAAIVSPTVEFKNILFTADSGIIFSYSGNISLLESGYINFNSCKFIAGTSPTFIFSNNGFFNVTLQSCVVTETTPGTTNFISWGATPFLNLSTRDSWISINNTTALAIPKNSFNVFAFENTYWACRLDSSIGSQSLIITAYQCVFNQTPASAGDPLVSFGSNTGSITANNCVIISTSGSLANSIAVAAPDTFRYNNCIWNNSLTIGATGRGEFSFCEFYGGSSAAITFSSSQACSIIDSIINSTNNPAIAGAGAGVLTIADLTFTSDGNISSSLTLAGATVFTAGNVTNVGQSNTGATNSLNVSNPSNTASSQAQALITVGGGTAGDAWTQWSIGSTQSYAMGIDNSDSDILKITQAASATVNPSTATVLQQFDQSKTRVLFPLPSAALSYTGIGSSVDMVILNDDNTNAASNARLNIQVGGTSGGDPYITFTNAGTNWSMGVDNSDSDKLKINISGTGPSAGTEVMTFTSGGAVSCIAGNFDVTRSASGSTVSSTISNTSNTASSDALDQITVAGTSAGDPFTTYTITGGSSWSHGVDNSSSDSYKISQGTALGTNDVIVATTVGEVTLPLTPAFSATPSGNTSAATGDGTVFTCIFNTEIFDQGNNFASNTFTAPVTGRYRLSTIVFMGSLGVAHIRGSSVIVTSNRSYSYWLMNPAVVRDVADGGILIVNGSVLADMDAADTATITLTIFDSTKTVIYSSGSYFTGNLEC